MTSNATLSQDADYSKVAELVAVMESGIERHRRGGLRVLVGSAVHDALTLSTARAISEGTPSELSHIHKRMIHSFVVDVPEFFPSDEIWLVNPQNLSIYELIGSRRRRGEDSHERMGWVDWNYFEACNHVERPENMLIAKNIRFLSA